MRNPEYERQWLEAVCRQANLSGLSERFSDAVYARLNKGEHEYEDNGKGFMSRSPHELAVEMADEASDLSGWGLLFSQQLRALDDLPEEEVVAIQADLVNAAAYSLRSWDRIRAIRDRLAEAPRRREPSVPNGRPYSTFFED